MFASFLFLFSRICEKRIYGKNGDDYNAKVNIDMAVFLYSNLDFRPLTLSSSPTHPHAWQVNNSQM